MQFDQLKRREFIAALGAATSPFAARAQQSERFRRIGVLISTSADDVEGQARKAAFLQGLGELGWSVGRNMQMDFRWSGGDAEHIRKYATELAALAPDVILASGGAVVGLLLQVTRTVPIVFTLTPDPVGAGFVQSLSHPGGNATGFTSIEYRMSRKWLELLREIAPRVARVGVLRDATVPAGIAQFAVLMSMAPSAGIELVSIEGRDAPEIESAVIQFARHSNGGLIVLGSALTVLHRQLIIALAARYALPTVYPGTYFVTAGGLISYAPDSTDPHRRAAGYVDRILRGEKPADLPVQNPVKYELAVNLKTAKALGLTVPDTLLVFADEIIE
jgi:putative tryptophan/tyrosine transport system substrate-binding protein